MSAVEPLPELCPRVVGATAYGKRVRTCGHTTPCPYHGDPVVRIVNPPRKPRP